MTKVVIDHVPGYLRLRASGHAGYGKEMGLGPGQDIVCAAVSILGQTAAQVLMDMEAEGILGIVEISIEPGEIDIRAVPKPSGEGKLKDILVPIRTGFELLSRAYPDYVKIGWANEGAKCDSIK